MIIVDIQKSYSKLNIYHEKKKSDNPIPIPPMNLGRTEKRECEFLVEIWKWE